MVNKDREDEPIRTQFKTDQATIQIIVNSTTSLEATEEGISDQRVPQSQQGSLCNWTESESTFAEKRVTSRTISQ